MRIIGHRGARALAPENTEKALRIGMQCASCVEVRMSGDGIPVIVHDPTLDRTTDGHGMVSETTLDALKRLDAGEGEDIPTLAEVLALVKGRSGLVLEIKESGTEALICRMVEESGIEEVILVSFHPGSIRIARELLPTVPAGLIYSQDIPDPLETAIAADAGIILPRFNLVGEQLVRHAKAQGLKVFPWTLNNRDDIIAAVAYGVDGFATDDPLRAREVLKSYA
jgi:glycerophosphoryl diester phosphodiesterase